MKVANDLMIEIPAEIPSLHVSDYITKARKILRDYFVRELFVRDDRNTLVGYIDIGDVLRIADTKSNVTVEGFVREAPYVLPETPLEEVALRIRSAETGSIAVVTPENELIGTVLLSEIFPILIQKHELHGTVGDYMSTEVVMCKPEDSIQKIYNLITESNYTGFPVARKNVLVGMVSESDLLKRGTIRKSLVNARKTIIETVMTTPAIFITQNEEIEIAAKKMVRHDISRLPVVIEGRIVGILDRHDVLKGLKL
jgi:CBS domain-containing protein